ncbi:hypothetical protein BO99DRAFT_454463 [Aspergillus violaceofuscus CBS 115571]|uniref:Uncharacterized protein n=1 Tax=Aspergillus violaceofuscus (strain CBS 115571) TaxID=1450538 RepID=A0A2V5HA10_ASPV1|nr:hypothetical protein BO99DRAFT_454463 [Aspergillus violaceofuscus CBS 115571]
MANPDLANYRTRNGQTAFHITNCWSAADNPTVKAPSMRLFYFFKNKSTDLSSLNAYGKSVLHYIPFYAEKKIRAMMKAGVRLRPDAEGQTELHLTMRRLDWELSGYQVLVADNKGRTPLYFYLKWHHYNPGKKHATQQIRSVVLDFLMEAGADADISAVSGKTAREIAEAKEFPYDFDKWKVKV